LAAAAASGIVVSGRNEDRGAAVADGIAATSGVPTLFVRGDLASVEDCRRMIAEADRRFGCVHVLVNAGASTERGTILDTSPDLFDRIFSINVLGPFFLMQEAIKLMIRDSVEGAICNIGSISALAGQPFINPYCASKGALTTLTANTAFSVMRNRIRVNQLNVGWMASDNEKVLQAAESGDPDWKEKGREPTSLRPAHRSRGGGSRRELPRLRRRRSDDGRDRQFRPVGVGRRAGRNACSGCTDETGALTHKNPKRSDEVSVGVGVIGTGVMGSEHTRLRRREAPSAHPAGVFDPDAARAQAAASCAAVFSDPQSLITSDRIEAVIIASPDATHAELTLACLEARKPVLCEKPLASSAAEALRVAQAEVALNRRLIQVGYMCRFDPGYQEIMAVWVN
jgi:NAD(P)-dependent dehydrogenase (short-subunit alcohol dehydrogenase family)